MAALGVVSATLAVASISPAQAATYNLDFDYLDLETRQNEITDSRGGIKKRLGIRNQWKDSYGLKIRGYNQNETESKPLLLFDSNPNTYTGGDSDLRSGNAWGTPEQGNILIIHEDGWGYNSEGKPNSVLNYNDPDDDASGGVIKFDFFNPGTSDGLVNFEEFSLLDIDDNGGGIRVEAYDTGNNKVLDVNIDALMDLHKSTNGGNGAAAAQGASVTSNGVTMTQVGTKWGNNSLFKFTIEDVKAAEVKFRYPGSGAITDLKWNDDEDPPQLPEPASVLGFILFGAVGVRSLLGQKQSADGVD